MKKWKDIIGYKGLYKVSNQGDVYSCISGKTLKKVKASTGYLIVSLCGKGSPKYSSIHRLVALAFLLNDPERKEVNHKDGVKTNNHVNNLEYVTKKENVTHAIKTGLRERCYGENKPDSKLTEYQVRDIRKSNLDRKQLAEKYGVHITNIGMIQRGKTWKHLI